MSIFNKYQNSTPNGVKIITTPFVNVQKEMKMIVAEVLPPPRGKAIGQGEGKGGKRAPQLGHSTSAPLKAL